MKKVDKIRLTCEICKKDFNVYPNRLKKETPRFCTNKCYGISLIGKSAWNKGKITSEETRKKQSDVALRQNHTGSKNNMWRGGSWIYWQQTVKTRDKYICQICGLVDFDIMEAAHIKPLEGSRTRTISGNPLNSLDNLVTLCPNCHKRYDKGLITL